jgi:hypothetical protein
LKIFLVIFQAIIALMLVSVPLAPGESTSLWVLKEANSVHLVTPAEEPVLLLSGLVNVKCSVLYSGTLLALGSPLVAHGSLEYEECENFIGTTSCEVKQTSSSALINVLRVGSEEAEVTGEGEVLVECGAFIHCKYKSEGLTGHGLGALKDGHVTIEEQEIRKVTGFFCPSLTRLHLLLESLEPLSIGS